MNNKYTAWLIAVLLVGAIVLCFVRVKQRQAALSDLYNDPVLSFRCRIVPELVKPDQSVFVSQSGVREFECAGGRVAIPTTDSNYNFHVVNKASCYEDKGCEIALWEVDKTESDFDSLVRMESESFVSPLALLFMSSSRFDEHCSLLNKKAKKSFGYGGIEIIETANQKSLFLYGRHRGDAQPCNASFWPIGEDKCVVAFISMKTNYASIRTFAHTIASGFRFDSATEGSGIHNSQSR
jgi:hypothetical protein